MLSLVQHTGALHETFSRLLQESRWRALLLFILAVPAQPMSEGALLPATESTNELQAPSNPGRSREAAVSALQSRSVFLPERIDARRKGSPGKIGSQKATRHKFNTAVCRAASIAVEDQYPISISKSRQICSRVRGILYNTFKVERGAHTYTELLDLCDMQYARRILEKYFPILIIAENQWAANSYIQETVRNDRPRNSGQNDSRPSTENGASHQSASLPQGSDVADNCSAEPEPALARSTPSRRRPPMAAAPPKRKRIRSRKQENRIAGSEN